MSGPQAVSVAVTATFAADEPSLSPSLLQAVSKQNGADGAQGEGASAGDHGWGSRTGN